MKKTVIITFLIVSFLVTGCSDDRSHVEIVLDQAEKQNADYDSITNIDSIKIAVEFMDNNGTPNERIRAHYLLGCAYRDMGEAPLALESYQNAVNCADTTQTDCDFRQLAKVHSQMAYLFYQQLLPYEQLEVLERQYKYAVRAGNILFSINAIEHKAGAYEQLNMPDSIIKVREAAYQLYKQHGFNKEAALAIGPIIDLLIDEGNLEKAKRYLDDYETEHGFGKEKIIENRRAIYYYSKGKYYLAMEKVDSAKFFFQKLLDPALDDDQHEAGYRGLYLLYKYIGKSDSLAKYADLCYQLNDASYSSNAASEMQQMQALYNYTRSQKEASSMKEKASQNRLMLLAALAILILVLGIGSYFYQKRLAEVEILNVQYNNTIANLKKAKEEKKKLEEENSSLLEEKNNEILKYEQQIREYEAKLNIVRRNVTNEELMSTSIYDRFRFVLTHTKVKLDRKDWKNLRKMIEEKIPNFYSEIHTRNARLQQQDYDICILIRLYFTPSEIGVLTDNSPSNISMKRIRLLKRIYGIDGSPEEFDKRIQSIS